MNHTFLNQKIMTIDLPGDAVCEDCGGTVEVRREGSTQGVFCTRCDWAVVTTYLPEIFRDETLYEISVTSGDYNNKEHIRAIAKLNGVNFLDARQLLQTQPNFKLCKGAASRVEEIRVAFELVGIQYEIRPPFPW
jgi:hypothetical protein